MTRRLIAALVFTSLAMGALMPAPANAGNDDMKRLLGGLATIVILGATYDHFRDKRDERRRVVTPVPSDRFAKIVPAQCFRRVETRHGFQGVFGHHCLTRHMRGVHRLPQACAIQVHTHRGIRHGYGARCLRDYGWRQA